MDPRILDLSPDHLRQNALHFAGGEELFCARISKAASLREKLFEGSDCYRLVFAEADDLPAFICDKYGDYFVVELLSLGMDQRRKLLVNALVKLFSPKGIYLRGDAPVRRKEGLPLENKLLRGEIPERILVRENGLTMEVDAVHGQKTGYFLDQKENRFAVRRYCRGARVLDCFCNSGGFSLNAATVAREVTAVDISPLALESVRANAARNGFTNIRTACADAFEYLRALRAAGKRAVYCTNNSSKTAKEYVAKLSRLGLWEEGTVVYTSGMAAAEYIRANHAGKKVFLVGTDALKEEFSAAGIPLAEEDAEVAVLAYDTTLTYEKLVRINRMIVEGKPYIATHADDVCPAEGVYPPDAGSFIQLLYRSSGRLPDVVCGKPDTVMGRFLLARLGARAEEIAMVGDRPYTDMRFGNNNGFYTLLVLSGEAKAEDVPALPAGDKPFAVTGSLNDIVPYLN